MDLGKKLFLDKETIAELSGDDQKNLLGGISEPRVCSLLTCIVSNPCNICGPASNAPTCTAVCVTSPGVCV